jgi:hypothetical protein
MSRITSIVKNKLFISHASADKEFIDIFLRFIYEGCGLHEDDVFCTSLSGTLLPGESFINDIKNNVLNSECAIFLITENYLDSYFCIAELGAAWILNKHIIPIVVPPVTLQEYDRTPLKGIQYLDVSCSDMPIIFRKKLTEIRVLSESYYKPTFQKSKKRFHEDILDYLKFLKKDSAGFYRARVIESKSRDIQMIPHPSGQGWTPGKPDFLTPWYVKRYNFCKLNGFIKSDNSISYETNDIAHWFVIEEVSFGINEKIKFKIRGRCHDFEAPNEKIITLSERYNESYR